jgi:hypothetical protein
MDVDGILDFIINNRLILVDGWYHYQKKCVINEKCIELLFENTSTLFQYYINIDLSNPLTFSLYSGANIQKSAFQKAFFKNTPRHLRIDNFLNSIDL